MDNLFDAGPPGGTGAPHRLRRSHAQCHPRRSSAGDTQTWLNAPGHKLVAVGYVRRHNAREHSGFDSSRSELSDGRVFVIMRAVLTHGDPTRSSPRGWLFSGTMLQPNSILFRKKWKVKRNMRSITATPRMWLGQSTHPRLFDKAF